MYAAIAVSLSLALRFQGAPSLDAGPEWPLVAEYSFGSLDDPETALSRIIAAAVDSTGHLILAQLYDHRVGVYDYDGRRVSSVGGRGIGPYELGSIQAVGARGDSIWVTDGRAASVKFFLRDGTWLGSNTAIQSLGAIGLAKAGYPLRNGYILSLPAIPMASLANRVVRVPWVRFGPDGQVVDTLMTETRSYAVGMLQLGDRAMWFQQPLQMSDLVAVAPDGTGLAHAVLSDTTDWAVSLRRIDAEGSVIFSRRYSAPRRRLTRDLLKWTIAHETTPVVEAMAATPGFSARRYKDAYSQAVRLPEVIPAVLEMHIGADGTIWLRREWVGADDQRWVAIDGRTGDILGRIQFSGRSRMIAASSAYVWMEELDDLDVVHVARYRIVKH
jgi:hypothetical protein